jgi:hypothetical protein
MLSTDPLSNRAVSAFPISVATSLALESIFKGPNPCIDPERVIPQQVDINKYDEFYVNLSTLFRNIVTALSKEDYLRVGVKGLKDTLAFEMEMIESIFKNEGYNKVKVIFYACQYKSALSVLKHPHAQFRSVTTEKQKEYKRLHDDTLSTFLKSNNSSDRLKIFDSEIKPLHSPKALILTHIPYDLLSYKNFQSLDLIESHTGVLKNKHQWYTKYHDGKALNNIPFLCGFLQVFGDSEFYKPFDIRVRKSILELANENRWSQITTLPKIIQNLDSMKDHYTKEILKKMLHE